VAVLAQSVLGAGRAAIAPGRAGTRQFVSRARVVCAVAQIGRSPGVPLQSVELDARKLPRSGPGSAIGERRQEPALLPGAGDGNSQAVAPSSRTGTTDRPAGRHQAHP